MPKRLITHGQRKPWRSGRGGFLLAFAVLVMGYGYALTPATTIPRSTLENLSYAFHFMSPFKWGIIWMVLGFVSGVGSIFKFDRWAFAIQSFLFSLWALFYLVAWVRDASPASRPWLSMMIYGAVGIAVTVASGHLVDVGTIERAEQLKGDSDGVES